MISGFIAVIALTLLVLVIFFFPVLNKKINFNEKDEAIKIYREELKYIECQYKRGLLALDDKEQLLEELDKKSATAIIAIDKKPYSYKFSFIPYIVIVIFLTIAVLSYHQYYQESGIKKWQNFKNINYGKITEGLFDANLVNNVVSISSLQDASYYCFSMQQALLKDYDANPDTLANLAQCHLSAGYYQLSEEAIKRGLKKAPDDINLNYLMTELSYANTNILSAGDIERLSKILKTNPNHVKSIRLLAINSLNQGKYKQAQFFFSKLREFAPNDPNLISALDSLDREIKEAINNQDANNKKQEDINNIQLNIKVSIDKALTKNLIGAKVLFIIVKSVDGQLLMATKNIISDFSKAINITVKDNQKGAMQIKPMAGLDKFNIVARISINGSPMARSGDLTSSLTLVELPQQKIADILINKKVP